MPKRFRLEAIRELIREAGSQEQLARRSGLDRRTIGRVADGTQRPTLETVAAVADAMGKPLEWFLSEEREREATSLREAVRKANISQAALARMAKVPASTLSEAVRGRRRLDPDQARAVAAALAGRGVTLPRAARGFPTAVADARAARARMETLMREPLSLAVRDWFGLDREPFGTVDFSQDALLKTRDYQLAYEQLFAAAEAKEFIILTGPVGVGKTHILHAVLADLRQRERFKLCVIPATETDRLSVPAVCHAILDDFAVTTLPARMVMRARLVQRVLLENDQAERSAIVVCDEAHDLTPCILLQLKRFHEMVSPKKLGPVLGIILCGQLNIENRLKANPLLREVAWRACCVKLEGLKGEVRTYLEHKLRRAGGSIQAWDKAATDELEARTVLPLAVNVVAAKAMALAWQMRVADGRGALPRVKADDVRTAADQVL